MVGFLFNDNSLIMKQKIKEALRQEYKSRLELDDDRLDGVAAFASTFVADESKIEEFVKNEATLAMLKSYQSVLDKDRAKRNKPEPTPKPSDNGNPQPEPNLEPKPQDAPDIAAIVAQAVAAAINPLQEKLNAFESAKTAELAVKQAQEKFGADEWVSGYPELRDSAWAQAMRIYDRTGKSMTADELHTEAMEIFKPLAKAKGLDISKPFQSDGGAGAKPDFSADVELLKNEGVDFGE
jgi:hypothetical protein